MACSGCTRRGTQRSKVRLPRCRRATNLLERRFRQPGAPGMREAWYGQAEAGIASRGPLRGAEKITHAQNRQQVHRATDIEAQKSQDEGKHVPQARATETTHCGEPSSRRGFQGRWFARLREIPRPRN